MQYKQTNIGSRNFRLADPVLFRTQEVSACAVPYFRTDMALVLNLDAVHMLIGSTSFVNLPVPA